jgi:hypothetical protein
MCTKLSSFSPEAKAIRLKLRPLKRAIIPLYMKVLFFVSPVYGAQFQPDCFSVGRCEQKTWLIS